MSERTEDGMGFAGLVPSKEELRQEKHDDELRRLRAENQRLREDLQRVTKSRDLYMAEFNRFNGLYWDRVSELKTARAENQRLRRALRECVECLDFDNLTQQSRYREWKKMVRGEE